MSEPENEFEKEFDEFQAAAAAVSVETAVFPPLMLLTDERRYDHDKLQERVFGAVKPTDFIEQLFTEDVIELTWDANRLRRFKIIFLASSICRGVDHLLRPLFQMEFLDRLLWEWRQGKPEAIKQVASALESIGQNMATAAAHTMVLEIEALDRLDQIIARTEARRNAALQEIDRRRAALAQRLRRAVQAADEAEVIDHDADAGAGSA